MNRYTSLHLISSLLIVTASYAVPVVAQVTVTPVNPAPAARTIVPAKPGGVTVTPAQPPFADPKFEAAAKQGLADLQQVLYQDPASPVAGNAKGDVTVVEFFDYGCGYCRRAAPAVRALIKNDPGVRVIFKEFPVSGRRSEILSRAGLAAHRQGKYHEMHAALMAAEFPDQAGMEVIAGKLGLDIEKLRADMQHPMLTEALRRNFELARMLNIGATPTFVVGDNVYAAELTIESLTEAVRVERSRPRK